MDRNFISPRFQTMVEGGGRWWGVRGMRIPLSGLRRWYGKCGRYVFVLHQAISGTGMGNIHLRDLSVWLWYAEDEGGSREILMFVHLGFLSLVKVCS